MDSSPPPGRAWERLQQATVAPPSQVARSRLQSLRRQADLDLLHGSRLSGRFGYGFGARLRSRVQKHLPLGLTGH